ncbi:glycosyl transferase [Phyllobacterium brassicacearum]|uniref:Glycosyl transferase n=1 Tax=Phyllobacterium brassicacearum TaxID=314235 RepID=A0A2P7BP04_9HYPH|nr:glycosyltransferase family 4 protein [Phyllobacterium brassicacearum]PSH68198.1 glycosyl transferase [Phyllobacterium brassicacearum]TDQ29564.1 glycosyltransferase involved in cell wall biosynthesis [Phyllobacterium brassicacearum]
MHIAFYAPLKSPNHPVPSGDRQMARLLIAALRLAGHSVEIASELRSFSATPEAGGRGQLAVLARREVERLSNEWRRDRKPDLWFCYHPYYKAPDLIGPPLVAAWTIPCVTAEASYSRRRADTDWAGLQSLVVDMVRKAAVNICFTRRDEVGLAASIPEARLERLEPFIDVSAFRSKIAQYNPKRLVTVAMMRPGDKLESYRMLARALALIVRRQWRLTVIGDGPARDEVRAMFADFGQHRVEWLGQKQAAEIEELLGQGGTYVWPGTGEAYGIAYMEAQAAGLPVVAQATAGVPEVVQHGVTGILTETGDIRAYADAIAQMLDGDEWRSAMGREARRFVLEERSLEVASKRLDQLLRDCVERGE